MSAALTMIRRCVQLPTGAAAIGVGIAAMIHARAGLLPWDVWHVAVANWARTWAGQVSVGGGVIATAAIAVIASILLGEPVRARTTPGLLVGLVVPGIATDLALAALPDAGTLSGQVGYLIGGAIVFATGSAAMVGSGLGAGPRDRVMQALVRRGLSVPRARIGLDVVALLAGTLLAGPVTAVASRQVWVGTVIVAIAVGPLVALLLPRLTIDKNPAEQASTRTSPERRRTGRHRASRRRRPTRRPAASGQDLMADALTSVTVLPTGSAGLLLDDGGGKGGRYPNRLPINADAMADPGA